MLKKRGIRHNVLNAKHHEKEAQIIAEAGRKDAVTIATNMAGRGTDIILGGNPEFEARREMEKLEYTPEQISFATSFVSSTDPVLNDAREVFNKLLGQYKEERKAEQQQVRDLLVRCGQLAHGRVAGQAVGRGARLGLVILIPKAVLGSSVTLGNTSESCYSVLSICFYIEIITVVITIESTCLSSERRHGFKLRLSEKLLNIGKTHILCDCFSAHNYKGIIWEIICRSSCHRQYAYNQ